MSKKKYVINGKIFIGQSSMLHYFNLSRDIFYRRIKNGESLKKALRPKEGKTGPKKVIYNRKEKSKYIKNKIKLYAKKNKIKKLEDWYKIPLSEVHSKLGINSLYPHTKYKDTIDVIQSLYKKKIYPWLFGMSPMGLWDKKENRIAYIKWLGRKLKFKKIKDWYKLNTIKDFHHNSGGGLLVIKKKDKDQSVLTLLKEAYPYYDWKPWLFKSAPQSFWNDMSNQKSFLKWVLKKEKINLKNDSIYKLNSTIIRKYNGHVVLRQYDNFVECLTKIFPEKKFDRFKFFHKGRGFWEDKDNHKIALLHLGEKLGFKKKNDWYAIQYDDFEKLGLSSLISQKGYNHSPGILCKKLLPELNLDINNFDFSSKYEFRARCFARCLYGSKNLIKNAKLDFLRYEKSNKKMELDILIPKPGLKDNWMLAIEYNGSHHYYPKFQTQKEFKHRLDLDKEKKQKCPKFKIKLIVIKYSKWDGLPDTFIKLLEKEIHISKGQKNKFWLNFKKEDIYKDVVNQIRKKTFN